MAMPTLNEFSILTDAGFSVEAAYSERGLDMKRRWYVTATKRSLYATGGVKNNGRPIYAGAGKNEFVGAGDTIKAAITNLIDNANEMAREMDGYTLEPNTDAATALEQPIKFVKKEIDSLNFFVNFDKNAFSNAIAESLADGIERGIDKATTIKA